MKTDRALELARAAELAMHAVYDELAKLTQGSDPGLVDMWQQMAAVESHHAHLVEQTLKDLDDRALAVDVDIDGNYVEKQIDRFLTFRDRLRKVAVTIDEIFHFALDMETSEQNGILLALLQQQNGELPDGLGEDVAPDGGRHIAPILDAIEKLAGDPALLERARRLRKTWS